MARARAVFLGQQGHHDITHFRAAAQEIVAHKAIEIERCGGAEIGFHRGRFGELAREARHVFQNAASGLKARTFRHVDHDLHFGLVVERQQFDRDRLEIEHRAGKQRRHTHSDQEIACRSAVVDDPVRDLGIEPA